MATALLFDKDQVAEIEDWTDLVERLRKTTLLWIDLGKIDEAEARLVSEALDLSGASEERLASSDERPYFGDFDSYLHVSALAPGSVDGRKGDLVGVDCLVSERWVVTAHEHEVDVLEDFRERAGASSGDLGRLDGLEFLATLLEWVLNTYSKAFDGIEDDLAEFDSRVLEGRFDDAQAELDCLIELRAEIRILRKALVSHRELFLTLARPELEAIAKSSHAERFDVLRVRLEETIQSARDSRDSIVGSFSVLTAHNDQRQNEIMKVLTLASVLFLPGALIAGVLGMNFRVGLFDRTYLFGVVVTFILGTIAATVAAARLRKWI